MAVTVVQIRRDLATWMNGHCTLRMMRSESISLETHDSPGSDDCELERFSCETPSRSTYQNLPCLRKAVSVAQEMEGRLGRGALLLRALPASKKIPDH